MISGNQKMQRWTLLLIALTLLSCESETAFPYTFCENENELAIMEECDIDTPACQQSIFEATRCINGSNMPMPPVRIVTDEAYLEELGFLDTDTQGLSDTETASDTEPLESDSDSESVDYWTASMQLLALMAQETSVSDAYRDEFVPTILAYYSYEYQDVTIIDHSYHYGDEDTDLEIDIPYFEPLQTLAHEYTHAIQDYEVGLKEQRELYSYNDDILMAQGNIYEGDAEVRSDFAYALLMGQDFKAQHPRTMYEQALKYYKTTIATAASPYIAAKSGLQYATGALYVYDTFINEGLDGMNRLRENFPTSTVYWMAGYDASRPTTDYMSKQSRPTHFNQPLICGDAAAPVDYSFIHQDTLGAAMLFAVLSSQSINGVYPVDEFWDFSIQWRADALQIYQETNGTNVAIAWHLRMASARDAKTLSDMLQLRHPNARLFQFGSEVIEFLAEDQAILSGWANSYRCNTRRD